MVAPALELRGLTAGYGRAVVLRDVSLSVAPGEVVAVEGADGAGRTTALRATAGLVRTTGGHVLLAGAEVTGTPPHRRARAGLCFVPAGVAAFRGLSVRENLRLVASGGSGPCVGGFP